MSTFEELENSWASQSVNQPNETQYKSVLSDVRKASKNYKGNQIILIVTAISVFGFAVSVSGFTSSITALGFALMIGSLILRILFEAIHNYKLQHLNITKSTKTLKEKLLKHYKQRKWIHYLLTPLCLLTYAYGFYVLLPSFKLALSDGFYTYILISAPILFVLLVALLVYVIKKENRLHVQIQAYFQ